MAAAQAGAVFAGSIPQFYDRHLVPLIFASYAADLAARVRDREPARVLEVAAGTGAVTRELARVLAPGTRIVATDLNRPMLDHARTTIRDRAIEWRQADAQALPFADGSFDVVTCQFGAMFFPDRARAYAEARRVLRPGGTFLFSVWDRIDDNEFAHVVTESLAPLFPAAPPRFLARLPHGYHDVAALRRDVARGGFTAGAEVVTLAHRSRAPTAQEPAFAYCEGTPLRNEIEAHGADRLAAAAAAAAALAHRFGPGPVDGKIQAHVVTVAR
ncbi:MAG: class I SAM-dependent methyltransferase [Burkholderiales bacterium]